MLSIRTQDRMALVPYNGCYIETHNMDDRKEYVLRVDVIGISDSWFNVGYFKTKERALEVLDEIEEYFKAQTKSTISNESYILKTVHYDLVYQMPKEE